MDGLMWYKKNIKIINILNFIVLSAQTEK